MSESTQNSELDDSSGVVDTLRGLLAAAEAGHIRTIGYVAVLKGSERGDGVEINLCSDGTTVTELLYLVDSSNQLQRMIMDSARHSDRD